MDIPREQCHTQPIMKSWMGMLIIASLFTVSARGDTIELKTGERIEGAFKQATSAGAVIEVGGQSITIPLENVQAIYFGLIPGRPGSGPKPSLVPPPIVTK